ncbi:MAG: RNA 2',3'-cyclic phosphodiesterase [Colwellia sp.]|nr:RNA 2',3'-cyclic phosphodiesterase [Colwellia sp.]
MSRLFFALDISNADKQLIDDFVYQNVAVPFKVIPKNNYHITLCFLGSVNINQKEVLIQKAKELNKAIAPITVNSLLIDHIGLFKRPKVLYLGNSEIPDWLLLLASGLTNTAKKLTLFQEDRSYLAHISIFRKAHFIPDSLKKPKIHITINSFSLYQSISINNQVLYKAIKTWYLDKSL